LDHDEQSGKCEEGKNLAEFRRKVRAAEVLSAAMKRRLLKPLGLPTDELTGHGEASPDLFADQVRPAMAEPAADDLPSGESPHI
jgi:hypothetical protein